MPAEGGGGRCLYRLVFGSHALTSLLEGALALSAVGCYRSFHVCWVFTAWGIIGPSRRPCPCTRGLGAPPASHKTMKQYQGRPRVYTTWLQNNRGPKTRPKSLTRWDTSRGVRARRHVRAPRLSVFLLTVSLESRREWQGSAGAADIHTHCLAAAAAGRNGLHPS